MVHPTNLLNHWGIDVSSRQEVDEAHQSASASANQDKYNIRRVTKPQEMQGVYSFYMDDLDHNWWKIQFYENGFQHDDFFDYGDRFKSDEAGNAQHLEELQVKFI